jgi:hypothetical protein
MKTQSGKVRDNLKSSIKTYLTTAIGKDEILPDLANVLRVFEDALFEVIREAPANQVNWYTWKVKQLFLANDSLDN